MAVQVKSPSLRMSPGRRRKLARRKARLRAAPAYRRMVWATRLAIYALGGAIFVALLAVLGFREKIPLMILFGSAWTSGVIGWLIGATAVIPFTRLQRRLLGGAGFNIVMRSAIVNGMIIRDAVRFPWNSQAETVERSGT